MSIVIDPLTSDAARVDSSGRLQIRGTTEDNYLSAVYNQKGFFISSGIITLTSDSESALLYIQNNEESDLVVTQRDIIFGNSTGGSGNITVYNVIEASGGTLISAGTDGVSVNSYGGSPVSLNATLKLGAEGLTLTGDIKAPTLYVAYPERTFLDLPFVIPRGESVGISIVPPSGNTNIEVQVNVTAYLADGV